MSTHDEFENHTSFRAL